MLHKVSRRNLANFHKSAEAYASGTQNQNKGDEKGVLTHPLFFCKLKEQ
jgi:hypothetical protein